MNRLLYPIIVEPAGDNFSAYSPDVPGCIATGDTLEETIAELRDALAFHFEGLAEDGDPIPDPRTYAAMVDVPVPATAIR